LARRRPYDQRPRRDLTTWDTRTASPAVRTGHRLKQRHRPHHLPIEGGQGIHGVVLRGRDHLVPDHQGLAVHRPVQLGMPRPLPTETSAGRHRTARCGDGWSTNRRDRPRPEETRQAGGCSSGPPGVRRPTTHHGHQHQRTSERRCPTHSTSASSIVSVDGSGIAGACLPDPQRGECVYREAVTSAPDCVAIPGDGPRAAATAIPSRVTAVPAGAIAVTRFVTRNADGRCGWRGLKRVFLLL